MSILKVAAVAGVSKSTVSRVISNTGPVKAATREKILKTIEALGYQPNVFAQGMKTNQSRTIAVLIPDYANPFFAVLLAAVEKALRPHHYMAMVLSTGDSEEAELESLRGLIARRIDGLIFHSYNRHEKTLRLLKEINTEIPVVFMDQISRNSEVSGVFIDGFESTKAAVTHLIQSGCQRVAYLDAVHEATSDRFSAYQAALKEAGIKAPKSYVYRGDFSMESGYAAGEYFLGLKRPPDGIAVATDNMAIGLMKYLISQGIKIPEQISVIGFDNLAMSSMVTPALSTIAIPIETMGQKAVEMLIQKITGGSSEPIHLALHCELLLRDSTRTMR